SGFPRVGSDEGIVRDAEIAGREDLAHVAGIDGAEEKAGKLRTGVDNTGQVGVPGGSIEISGGRGGLIRIDLLALELAGEAQAVLAQLEGLRIGIGEDVAGHARIGAIAADGQVTEADTREDLGGEAGET